MQKCRRLPIKVITSRTRSMSPPRLWGCMISSSATLQVCSIHHVRPVHDPSPRALPGVLVRRSVRPLPSAAVTLASEMARHASIPQAGRAATGSVNGRGHETLCWLLSCIGERERGWKLWSFGHLSLAIPRPAGPEPVGAHCSGALTRPCIAGPSVGPGQRGQAKMIRNFKAKDWSHAIHSPSQHAASVGWRGTLGERPAGAGKKNWEIPITKTLFLTKTQLRNLHFLSQHTISVLLLLPVPSLESSRRA